LHELDSFFFTHGKTRWKRRRREKTLRWIKTWDVFNYAYDRWFWSYVTSKSFNMSSSNRIQIFSFFNKIQFSKFIPWGHNKNL